METSRPPPSPSTQPGLFSPRPPPCAPCATCRWACCRQMQRPSLAASLALERRRAHHLETSGSTFAVRASKGTAQLARSISIGPRHRSANLSAHRDRAWRKNRERSHGCKPTTATILRSRAAHSGAVRNRAVCTGNWFRLQGKTHASLRVLINRALQVKLIHADTAFAAVFYAVVKLSVGHPVIVRSQRCSVFQIDENRGCGNRNICGDRIRIGSSFQRCCVLITIPVPDAGVRAVYGIVVVGRRATGLVIRTAVIVVSRWCRRIVAIRRPIPVRGVVGAVIWIRRTPSPTRSEPGVPEAAPAKP